MNSLETELNACISALRANTQGIEAVSTRLAQLESTVRPIFAIISILSQKGIINDEEIAEELSILTDKNSNPETAKRTYVRPEREEQGSEPDSGD